MGLGPSTKETTLHHYRDPLVARLAADEEVDFPGVLVLATSDVQEHKALVAKRAGAWCEAMRLDGAIVSIDSWGNCHIDYAAIIEALGERRIPLVGLSFVGNQAAFVVSNSYMGAILDLNKTTEGVESLVVGQNTTVDLDALKAVSILKRKIRKKFSDRSFAVSSVRDIRCLLRRTFPTREVRLGECAAMRGATLTLDTGALERIAAGYDAIRRIRVRLVEPGQLDTPVNAILDFSPLAVKAAGDLGGGITHLLSGARLMLTAVEEGGFQPINCGAAAGILSEKVVPGRPGTPDPEDWIIHVDVLLAEGEGRTREGIWAAHCACDAWANEVRGVLRGLGRPLVSRKEEFWDRERRGGMRIALIKVVSGLGCLYDTVFQPKEPGGCLGGTSVMDVGNMPLLFSANEYRDGVIHSLT